MGGRTAVVTGAASGIGRAVVEVLVDGGYCVVAADIRAEGLAWCAGHERVAPVAADASSIDDNEAMVATALATFGRLDVAVLNAGVVGGGPFDGVSVADIDRVVAVNMVGVAHGIRAALPALRASGGGPSIVVTASVSGLGGDPDMWVYNMAKGGVINLVRSAAFNLGPEGIRVNAVCPGPTHTGLTAPIAEERPQVYESLRQMVPLQRWGEPSEIAAVIAFLAGPAASFVNGAIIPVDGGVTASSGQFAPVAH